MFLRESLCCGFCVEQSRECVTEHTWLHGVSSCGDDRSPFLGLFSAFVEVRDALDSVVIAVVERGGDFRVGEPFYFQSTRAVRGAPPAGRWRLHHTKINVTFGEWQNGRMAEWQNGGGGDEKVIGDSCWEKFGGLSLGDG